MNATKHLKIEIDGIASVIEKYTTDPVVLNYVMNLRRGMMDEDADVVVFCLNALLKWYDDEFEAVIKNLDHIEYDRHQGNRYIIKTLMQEFKTEGENIESEKGKMNEMNNKMKVFIVHGHDNEAKLEVKTALTDMGLEAIILHEQADEGMTIIEKIERYTDVSFAVVLYTECDLGRKKTDGVEAEKYRARQNVVFEHGYLIGKLGRKNVCALVKGDVETPGDVSGVVYTKMDNSQGWIIQLAKNLAAAGIDIDSKKMLS